ncbi:MAG: hypothetical protein GC152_02955 [Alphaproteobacteria bacterium]|nr:hypothetical protein [Alphaproteobacteria bacterium]
MASERLKLRIADIRRAARAPGELATDPHEQLFAVYRDIDALLRDGEQSTQTLVQAMNETMRAAAEIPATTPREVLFKMALWRWDAPGIDYRLADLSRHDAVAYSAFRDLAGLLDEEAVMKDSDAERAQAKAC